MLESTGMIVLVFLMRVMDVSMGTVRNIVAIQGRSVLASVIGFFEVLVFLFAIGQVLSKVSDNPSLAVAYAGGFAAGTWLGIKIEERIALGLRLVRVITVKPNDKLVKALRENNFGVTVLDGEGLSGPVYVLFSIVERRQLKRFRKLVEDLAPRAFFTEEDTRFATGTFKGRLGK